MLHARIQKIMSGGGSCLTTFFLKSATYFTKGRTDLPQPLGPIASRGGSVPANLRKPIATCDFPGAYRPPEPAPLWIRKFVKYN